MVTDPRKMTLLQQQKQQQPNNQLIFLFLFALYDLPWTVLKK